MRWLAKMRQPSLSGRWFAWYPVKTGSGWYPECNDPSIKREWVWFEWVERRFWSTWGGGGWDYYAIPKGETA